MLLNPFSKIIAHWCLDYYKQYQKAPSKHIKDIFEQHAQNGLGADQADLIAMFLESISSEYEHSEQFNSDYLLTQAEKYFKQNSLKALSEDISALLSQGEVQEAEALLTEYKRVERPQSKGINPLTDREAIYRAIEKREENILFTMPGALGQFLGPIERSSFIGILAPEKRGKSFFLLQTALWALQRHCNVAFIEIGDMMEEDLVRRIAKNITKTTDKNKPFVKIPMLDCFHNQMNTCTKPCRTCAFGVLHRRVGDKGDELDLTPLEEAIGYVPCTQCKDKEYKGAVWHKLEQVGQLQWKQAWEIGKKVTHRAGDKQFKLIVYPNDSVNVRGIETQLDQWEQNEGFIPDLVVIDYADNIAPLEGKREERFKQNDTWKALRALSQKRFCSVITATQADAASYDKKSLDASNFSEAKSKYAHVTGFWTLNQTPDEKRLGIMRIGQMFVRENDSDLNQKCTILQCLDIGRPYLGSFL